MWAVAEKRWRFLFWAVVFAYTAAFLVYALTIAFGWDEAYHLLAAQLVLRGRRPYLDFCFPQTLVNLYWNAGLMAVFGQKWRVAHTAAALLTTGAALLMADYVRRRFPVREWALPAAFAAFLAVALNTQLFGYAPLAQPYGMCLFALALGFRLAVQAPGRTAAAAGAGLCAGIAAGSSLLTATAAPVLLAWIVFYSPEGRWRKAAAFAAAAAIPFLPVLWLAVQGPRQTWFNVVQYHAVFRKLYWSQTTRHDLEVLTSWINSGQALATGALAIAGLWLARRAPEFKAWRAELYLCAWMAAAIAAEVGRAHPTFAQYFLLTTPFVAVLAAAGAYAIGSRTPALTVGLFGFLLLFGLGRALYDDREATNWKHYERIAAKIDAVTPPGAPVLADEPMYFLTGRTPPPGFELYYTHKLQLPAAERALLHIVTLDEVAQMARAGKFATAYTCDEDLVDEYRLKDTYRQNATVEDCFVFWDRKAGN
jgi:hypothetical protein